MSREIRLLELELRRFKGVEAFVLDADGSSVIVRGDNATGKTTLHDAYTWLLFGKDSANRAAFELKTLNADGSSVSGVDHEVRGVFAIDGERVELRRVYSETWTKKRGAAKAELTGHSTAFEVDGVPVKKGEWTDRVGDLFGPEERLRLLTDPLFFASVVPWDRRRAILLELIGDVTEADVEALEPDLVELRKALGKRSHDEHRKVITARRREVNSELNALPDRVDEAARAVEGGPFDELELIDAAIEEARARVTELEAARAPDARLATARAELTAARAAREAAIREAERRAESAKRDRADRLQRAESEQARARASLERHQGDRERRAKHLSAIEEKLEQLRAAYAEVRAEQPEPQVEAACPTCHRPLTGDALEAARREAIERARADQARRIREIRERGDSLKADRAEVEALVLESDELLERAEQELKAAVADLELAREAPAAAPAANTTDADAEIERLVAAIDELEQGDAEPEDRAELDAAQARVSELLEQRAGAIVAQRATARIAELEARERELATEVERIDRQLHLLDLRARARARVLTERVDERFGTVRFRLFAEQLNGALLEACDLTVDGVPWGDLNHGARMNAGLEVLAVLGDHFGVSAPVWLDNAESVTAWRKTDAQTIRLEVDASAGELATERLA